MFVRRHPILLVLALVFFSVTVLVLVAIYLSPPSGTVEVKKAKRRTPANSSDEGTEETLPVISGGAIIQESRFHRFMVDALLITAAAILTVILVQGLKLLQGI